MNKYKVLIKQIKSLTYKLFNNKLILAKVFFSVFNIIIIIILNVFFSPEDSGELLYKQGLVFFLAGLSRLGSDFYWVSSMNNLIVSKGEIPFLLISTFFFSLIYYFFIVDSSIFDLFWLFLSISLVNILIFIGRIYQKEKEHIISLFILTVAPTILVVPIYWFFLKINIFILLTFSMTIMLILILLVGYLKAFRFKIDYTNDPIYKRFHFFPMIIYGVLNQNLIQLTSGLIGRAEQSAILVLFQRISGLVLWPQIFHMQTELNEIRDSTKTIKSFNNYLINYLRKTLKETIFYVSIIIIISSFVLYFNNSNYYLIGSLFIILFSCLINLGLGFIQYQIGITENGHKTFLAMLFSLIFNVFFIKLFNLPYISVALTFLFLHVINHISNYYIITNSIKNHE